MHATDNCFAGEDCIFMHNILLTRRFSPQTSENVGLEFIFLCQLQVANQPWVKNCLLSNARKRQFENGMLAR